MTSVTVITFRLTTYRSLWFFVNSNVVTNNLIYLYYLKSHNCLFIYTTVHNLNVTDSNSVVNTYQYDDH